MLCAIDGCGRIARGRGWCGLHYKRWYKFGDPLKTAHATNGAPLKWLHETALAYSGEHCLAWPFGKSGGYGRIYVDGKATYAHRVICEAVHGPAPEGRNDAAHSCGNGHLGCVNPAHLSWKTRAGNQADRLRHGTDLRGERHYAAKLTEAAVREIRLLAPAHSINEIGRLYQVSPAAIHSIVNGENWGWLE